MGKCFKYFFFFENALYIMKFQKKKYLKENTFFFSLSPLGEIYIDRCLQKEEGPKRPSKEDILVIAIIISPAQLLPHYFIYVRRIEFMKIMTLLEFLDRTGKHVSRKTFEKYKGEKKIFVTWEVLFS